MYMQKLYYMQVLTYSPTARKNIMYFQGEWGLLFITYLYSIDYPHNEPFF